MAKICFVEHDGTEHFVEAEVGRSLMQSAIDNAVPGIVADCGGSCSCATCHAYIEPRWQPLAGTPSDTESMILEGALHRRATSRLTCQVLVTPEMEGMRVQLPESQF